MSKIDLEHLLIRRRRTVESWLQEESIKDSVDFLLFQTRNPQYTYSDNLLEQVILALPVGRASDTKTDSSQSIDNIEENPGVLPEVGGVGVLAAYDVTNQADDEESLEKPRKRKKNAVQTDE